MLCRETKKMSKKLIKSGLVSTSKYQKKDKYFIQYYDNSMKIVGMYLPVKNKTVHNVKATVSVVPLAL